MVHGRETKPGELVARAIRRGGISWAVRELVARRRVSVLMYHDPAPDVLDRHLAYLRRAYSLVTLDEAVRFVRRELAELPPKPLVVTIDDGWRGNRLLQPVAERHGLRPAIYVCSSIVGTGRRFWWTTTPRASALKPLPTLEREAVLRGETGFAPTREYDGPPQALSAAEVAALPVWADVESHTRLHPILTVTTDTELADEVTASRLEVEALTSRPCRHFSYPNGDWGPREAAAVAAAGYRSARTTDLGWNAPGADPYALKILGTPDDASVDRLAADLAGLGFAFRWRERWKSRRAGGSAGDPGRSS